MSNGSSSRKKKATENNIDEVEELLRAAHDDMLLKLSLNSHIARSSSSSTHQDPIIDPDLHRRFEALKSNPNPKLPITSRTDTDKKNPSKVVDNIDESDDLFARFAALKNTLPSYSSSTNVGFDQKLKGGGEENGSENEEDEVEKMINWAIDAARLDPSRSSDVEDDDAEDDSDSEKDSDDEDNDQKKSKRK